MSLLRIHHSRKRQTNTRTISAYKPMNNRVPESYHNFSNDPVQLFDIELPGISEQDFARSFMVAKVKSNLHFAISQLAIIFANAGWR